ncbi:MAG TPA: MG2 domain-containing protein, partial [Candidatus Polarisedimenticolia bacterium]|nr:MG2 domain-containing protein [Candidatus Polarisedimenticolia bacterium]
VDEVTLQIDRVYRNNLFVLFEYHPDEVWSESSWGFAGRRLGDRLVEERLKLSPERNRRRTTPIELGRYVSGETPGLYRVALKRPDQYEARQRWLLITDLGIVAKLGTRECSVWISSFADLAAVPGAQVTLLSTQNQPLARGQTDASGFWRARELPEPNQQRDRPGMIVVEKGGDFSFLLLDRAGIDTAGADVGGASSTRAGYDAFVYGPRDIYRPGETAPGLIVVRDRSLKAAPSMPVLLRHKDPQGRQRATVRLSLDRRGQAAFRHEIPAYERTGRHLLEVLVAEEVVGRYPFHVEEFIPDRIKVEIAPSERPAGPGDTLAWDVAAAYLFGPRAAGLPAESRVRLEPALFAPAGFESYAFEDAGRVFEPRELAAFESLALDDQGRRRFETTIPVGLTPPSSLEAVLTARVQEQGGRGVSALARVKVHPFPFYLGLKKNVPEPAEPGRPVEFAWVSVRPDGAAVKSPELQARLYLDRWQTLLRRTPEGNYRYESVRDAELVETRSIAGGSDSGALSFTPREFGSYRVVLADEASGASTQVEFFAGGWGYSAWAIKDASRIEIEADRQEYRAGDTATVVVRTPFPGKLLLAVERDRVLEHQVHTLSGNTARLTVPIRAEHRPNVYVTAVLVRSSRDLQPGEAGRAFGAIPLAVDRSERRMELGIAAPREIRPGTRLGIRVTARPGSSVTVAAVDEGILQLIAQKTPDPFEHFYRKIRLGVRAYDIFAQLLPEVPPAARPATGGDAALEGLAQFVRTDGIRRVEPVAFWSGSLQAGSDGVASAEFEVPEFQGALRLMAVGHAEDRFGSTDALVRVRSPLVLLPTLPRSLSLQEQVLVPVTLRNDSGRAGEFDVSLSAEGPARVQGPSTQQIAIPDGRERTLHFEVVTSAMTGDVRFALVARGNGEEASVRTGVPVRADLPAVTLERVGTFDGPETSLSLEETARLRPGSARIELRISPLPLVRFSTRLRDLLHYPYGCVEQTVSSVFPLLYFGDLAREWEPETFRETDPDSLVQAGIRRLGSMQVHSGGFSNWPGQDETAPWGSVYAAHFLVEARRAGHQVDAWLYDRALE